MMERDADGWTATKIDRSMSLSDLRNSNETKFGDLTAPSSHSCREIESLDSSVIYTDKNVMECELPELIVCYKESTFHVKDICVDEGVHLQKSNMFGGDINEDLCIMLPSEKGSVSMEVKNKSDEPLPDLMESWIDNVSSKDKVDKSDCSPCNVLGKGVDLVNSMDVVQKDDSTDRSANIESTKMISLADLLSIHDPVLEKPYSGSLTTNGMELNKKSSEGSSGKTVSENHALVSTPEKSDDNAEEAVASSSDLVPAAEVSNSGGDKAVLVIPAVKEKMNESIEGNWTSSGIDSAESNNSDKPSYNSKVETGIITFDFDPSAPKANCTEECPNSGESTTVENPDTSKLEDAPRQSFSSQANGGFGESSFHVSGSIPGLISYSGAVPFSGNLSIRSDSSTTSTRSFAFPVLQSEWNTSPVRMAKADRRNFRKHKCWRQGLLCCRF